jgi:hypothetical protein
VPLPSTTWSSGFCDDPVIVILIAKNSQNPSNPREHTPSPKQKTSDWKEDLHPALLYNLEWKSS